MPSSPILTVADLTNAVKRRADELGFELAGVAPAVRPEGFEELRRWLDQGFAGEMGYIPRRESAYEHPRGVLPAVRSVIMLSMNYGSGGVRTATESQSLTDQSPTSTPSAIPTGKVARYAMGSRDYHDVLRERLKGLADFLHEQRPGCRTRACVDTAPLLERDFARLAGLGWFGKNTMLINKRQGSFFFLAALLTDLELIPDEPHNTAHCGTCTRCLDACPTNAFVEPYVLDARRCISYLTIELRDQPVPEELRSQMGEWIFGCDICQDVCPWNRKAPPSREPTFTPHADLSPINLERFAVLDDAAFTEAFAATPLHRTGRAALLRNAALVLGNRGDENSIPVLQRLAESSEPLVQTAAEWALGEIVKRQI